MLALRVVCLLLVIACWVNSARIRFTIYWADMFQANVSLTTNRDRSSGWQIILKFNRPVQRLTLWDQDVVRKLRRGREYIIKNRSPNFLPPGSFYAFEMHGKYRNGRPTSGTAEWYGGSTRSRTTSTSRHSSSGNTYARVIGLSWKFYEAQRSGVLPADNRIPWRGNSAERDGQDVGLDLSGGWYDAGDHVKFGLPMSSSTTMLLHGLYFFKDAYVSAGQYNEGLRQIRWPLDYFLKCHQRSDRFYAQVGNPEIDHAWWGRPEDMDEAGLARPAYVLGAGARAPGGADVMGETAAAFAAGSLVFKQSDPSYSRRLLRNAVSLYNLAKRHPSEYNAAIPSTDTYYQSIDWRNKMAHAAAWLAMTHAGTPQEFVYREQAVGYLDEWEIWALAYGDARALVNILLYHQTGSSRFRRNIENFLQKWLPGGSLPRTPRGLVYRDNWGSLRYSANSAFVALLAAKEGLKVTDYRSYAQSQIHYMLGLTGGRSYVVGFGNNPPKRPHHQAASCPYRHVDPVCDWKDYSVNRDNPHILYGALVGGPDQFDRYIDNRSDYIQNEVACGYNAGFTGALAGLRYFEDNPVAGK